MLYLDYLTFSSPVLMPEDTVYFKKLWKELLGGRPSASDILILSPYNFLAVDEMHFDMFVEVLAKFLKEHFMGNNFALQRKFMCNPSQMFIIDTIVLGAVTKTKAYLCTYCAKFCVVKIYYRLK